MHRENLDEVRREAVGMDGNRVLWLASLLALLVGAALSPAANAGEHGGRDALRVGLAKACITPDTPLWLHGYTHKSRFRPCEGKLNDLFAKAMAMEDTTGQRAVLITVDLCVLRPAEAKALFARLIARTGLGRHQIVINFSHTHSAPVIGASDFERYTMPEAAQQATLAYTEKLFGDMVDVAALALADLKPARLGHGRGTCRFVQNRRQYHADGRYKGMGPNPEKYVDEGLPVMRIDAPDGTPRAIVFGCACHAVTLDYNNLMISGDYPSFAQEAIESGMPGVQAMFVQGCGADANSEPRGGPQQVTHARDQGEELAAEVRRVAAGSLEMVAGPVRVKFTEVDLPLKAPPIAELEKMTGDLRHNAKRILAAIEGGNALPSHHRHPLAIWQFARGPALLWLSGEVVSGYVPLLRQALGTDKLWIAGYSNEVDGYLPDPGIIEEGGYEARGLVAGIGFYSKDAPTALVKAVGALMNE